MSGSALYRGLCDEALEILRDSLSRKLDMYAESPVARYRQQVGNVRRKLWAVDRECERRSLTAQIVVLLEQRVKDKQEVAQG